MVATANWLQDDSLVNDSKVAGQLGLRCRIKAKLRSASPRLARSAGRSRPLRRSFWGRKTRYRSGEILPVRRRDPVQMRVLRSGNRLDLFGVVSGESIVAVFLAVIRSWRDCRRLGWGVRGRKWH